MLFPGIGISRFVGSHGRGGKSDRPGELLSRQTGGAPGLEKQSAKGSMLLLWGSRREESAESALRDAECRGDGSEILGPRLRPGYFIVRDELRIPAHPRGELPLRPAALLPQLPERAPKRRGLASLRQQSRQLGLRHREGAGQVGEMLAGGMEMPRLIAADGCGRQASPPPQLALAQTPLSAEFVQHATQGGGRVLLCGLRFLDHPTTHP